jgi:hypothetical protein
MRTCGEAAGRARRPASGADAAKEAMGMSANVKRDGQQVYVADVPRPAGSSTVMASMASVLRALGEDVTYEYLMGVSSHAFRTQFSWCPSAPHANCGFKTNDAALKTAGYKIHWHELAMWDPVTRKQGEATSEHLVAARDAVKRSIDAGRPCLFGSEEEGVLAGYEPPGEKTTGWLCRPGPLGGPPKPDEPYLYPMKKLPWGVGTMEKLPGGPPPRRDSIVWSLQTAVRNARTEKVGGYAMGLAAWRKWIDELSGARKLDWQGKALTIDELDKDQWFGACLGNAWCYESLWDARATAGKYLRAIGGELGPQAAEHLRASAEAYEELARTLTPKCFTEIAPYPWMLKERENWPAEVRRAQAELMEKALVLERKAIDGIAAALDAPGKAGV